MKLLNYLPLVFLILYSCKSEPVETYQNPFSTPEFADLIEAFKEDRIKYKTISINFSTDEVSEIRNCLKKNDSIIREKIKSEYLKQTTSDRTQNREMRKKLNLKFIREFCGKRAQEYHQSISTDSKKDFGKKLIEFKSKYPEVTNKDISIQLSKLSDSEKHN